MKHALDGSRTHYREPMRDERLTAKEIGEVDRLEKRRRCELCSLAVEDGEAATLPLLAGCCGACEADVLVAAVATSSPPDYGALFTLPGADGVQPPAWLHSWPAQAQSLLASRARALRTRQAQREHLRARVESHRRALEGKGVRR